MRLKLAFVACLFASNAFAADPTPLQAYPTAGDHGLAIVTIPGGLDANSMAVPCGSSTVATGCISGGSATAGQLTYIGPASASVGTASAVLVPAGTYARTWRVCTLPASTTNVWLRPDGSAAVVGTGDSAASGGGCFLYGTPSAPLPAASVTAITDAGTAQAVTLAGG